MPRALHKSSIDKMKKFRDVYLDPLQNMKILEVGSLDVNGSYSHLFNEQKWTYHGADIVEGKNVNILLSNPYDWDNIEDNSYDVVVSGQTFEHNEYFWVTMLQINRVLKLEGLCCIIVPSTGPVHRYPVDCWRFNSDGLEAIAKWGKMEILEATTQTQNLNYEDGSDQWLDSMLVCMKISEIPSLKIIINTLSFWLGIKKTHEIETIQKNASIIQDIQIDKQKFVKSILRGILSEDRVYPKWYEAISYLMIVYMERSDLQNAFPAVSDRCDLLDLIQWAKDYGVNEDNRLQPYLQFYQKYFDNAKNL